MDAAARELVGDGGSVDVHCWRGRMRSATRRTQVHVAMCTPATCSARCLVWGMVWGLTVNVNGVLCLRGPQLQLK